MDSKYARASDAALLRERRDPEAAFSAFYRRHVGQVLTYLRNRGVDAHVASDVTSATFLAALRARRRYEPASESALPWLLTIASRQLSDVHRQGARQDRITRRFVAVMSRDLTPRDLAEYDDARTSDVDEALLALPEEQQLAVVGRVVDELAYPQLAERLGVSEPTARQRVSRGLKSLSSRVNPNNQERRDA